MCKWKKTVKEKVRAVVEEQEDNDYNAFSVSDKHSITVDVCVGSAKLNMIVDSGSTANIVDKGTWQQLKAQRIKCVTKVETDKKL